MSVCSDERKRAWLLREPPEVQGSARRDFGPTVGAGRGGHHAASGERQVRL